MLLSLAFAMISLYLLILTGSRSATIATLISAIALFSFGLRGKFSVRYLFFLITVFLTAIVGYFLLKELAPKILLRFSVEDIISTGGTNRAKIWEATIEHVIPNAWLLGVGLGGGNTVLAMEPYVSHALGVHNLYITLLAQVGIVGCFPFYAFWARCISKGIKASRNDFFFKIPLFLILSAFINGFGEEIYQERFLWFSAGLIFLAIYNIKRGSWGEQS